MQKQIHKTISVNFLLFLPCFILVFVFMLVFMPSSWSFANRAGQSSTPVTSNSLPVESKSLSVASKSLSVVAKSLSVTSNSLSGQNHVTGAFIVKKSFDYMRGMASISTVEMIIHRPRWERRMTINAWTLGDKNSIFFITAPPKDKGNGTLKKGRGMWIFNPKINRAIKLPPSMMSQSWMGSDFSNNDLAKTDSLLNDYTHIIVSTKTKNSLKIYTIQSTPKPDAPVIWGKLKLDIRQDFILLKEVYYDEDNKPVKVLTTGDIQMMGNRLFPRVWKMQKVESEESSNSANTLNSADSSDLADSSDSADSSVDSFNSLNLLDSVDSVDSMGKYTLLIYKKLKFLPDLPERLFTLSNLKNPGRVGER